MKRLYLLMLSFLLILSSCASLGVKSEEQFKIDKIAICGTMPQGRNDYSEIDEVYGEQIFYLFITFNKLETEKVNGKEWLHLSYDFVLRRDGVAIWWDYKEDHGPAKVDISVEDLWYYRMFPCPPNPIAGNYELEVTITDIYGNESSTAVARFRITTQVQGSFT